MAQRPSYRRLRTIETVDDKETFTARLKPRKSVCEVEWSLFLFLNKLLLCNFVLLARNLKDTLSSSSSSTSDRSSARLDRLLS